jgi:rhodanese-related sulfurtransferase
MGQSASLSNEAREKKWKSMYWKLSLAHRSVPELTAEEVLKAGAQRGMWPGGAEAAPTAVTQPPPMIIVDCRDPKEQAVSTIPHAITADAFKEQLGGDAVPKECTIVCYCTIGFRSGLFGKKMAKKLGPDQKLYNLKGSLLAWTHAHG